MENAVQCGFTRRRSAAIVIGACYQGTHVPYLSRNKTGERAGKLSERRQSVARVICSPSRHFAAEDARRLTDYAAPVALYVPFRISLKRIAENSRVVDTLR